MFGDLLRGAASLVGAIAGPIIGLSIDVIAGTLKITTEMAQEAINAGCESYEDIRRYHDL